MSRACCSTGRHRALQAGSGPECVREHLKVCEHSNEHTLHRHALTNMRDRGDALAGLTQRPGRAYPRLKSNRLSVQGPSRGFRRQHSRCSRHTQLRAHWPVGCGCRNRWDTICRAGIEIGKQLTSSCRTALVVVDTRALVASCAASGAAEHCRINRKRMVTEESTCLS